MNFLRHFRTHRRSWISLWLLLLVFGITLFAELLANDKPLLVKYRGSFYAPVFKAYSEKKFGGDFETEAVYRDAFVQKLIQESGGWMLWPPLRYGASTINYDLARPAPAPPSAENWLGVDDQGRDVLARLIYGLRISLLFGLCLTAGSMVIGVAAGLAQGFLGGVTDLALQRFTEIWSGLPELFLLIILASFIVPSFSWLLVILLLFSWMGLAQLVRSEALRTRNFEYVRAARVLGLSEWRIALRHVLPNAMIAAVTMLPFLMSGGITALTTLDFLGFGLPAGSPSLGELLLQGKNNPQAPWLGLSGFFALAGLLVLIMFVAEGIRDALDPKKRRAAP